MLVNALLRCDNYAVKGEEERSNSSDSSDENEDDEGAFEHEELASDEDEIDEESTQYLEMLQKKVSLVIMSVFAKLAFVVAV